MTGAAASVSAKQARISTEMGATSITRKRGVRCELTDQNRRSPLRVQATSAATPDPTSAAQNVAPYAAPSTSSEGPTAARSRANLARKPDNGGSPTTSSTQHTKAMPRNAIAAGIATPISSVGDNGSGGRTPKP